MNRRPYAGEITKEYLKKLGIEHVSTDGTEVIWKGKQKKINTSSTAKKQYGKLLFHDPELYASVPVEERKDHSGQVAIDIHVLNYVWNTGNPRPAGMVIDHVDNDPTNNDVSNLQCITQQENLAKERTNWNIRELPCKLNKPRSFYEKKLEGYITAHEQAKAAGDAEGAHHFRSYISQTRARLRYYDNHIAEVISIKEKKEAEETRKREYHERAKKKRELKYELDRSRKIYKELLEAYGKDDPIVYQYKGEYQLAKAVYQGFCAKSAEANLQSAKLYTGEAENL